MKAMAILLVLIISTFSGAAGDVSTLKVVGEGRIAVPADTVFITISVTNEDEKTADASNKNDEAMNRTIEALIDAGAKREDVSSGRGRSVQKIKTSSRVCNNTTCVTVTNNAVSRVKDQVTIRSDAEDVDLINRIIEASRVAGAEAEISGYDLVDETDAVAEARQRAVEDAEDEAANLASAAGLILGERLEISELSQPQISQQTTDLDPIDMMNIFDLAWTGMFNLIDAESTESGMVEVVYQVLVTYEVTS
jgi:uncharacterized protein YggE